MDRAIDYTLLHLLNDKKVPIEERGAVALLLAIRNKGIEADEFVAIVRRLVVPVGQRAYTKPMTKAREEARAADERAAALLALRRRIGKVGRGKKSAAKVREMKKNHAQFIGSKWREDDYVSYPDMKERQ